MNKLSSFTPKRWQWRGNVKTGAMYLSTVGRGLLTILDIGRKDGLFGTGPHLFRFRDDRIIMHPGDEYVTPDHNGDWVHIDHPDAILIEAAPELRDALVSLVEGYWGDGVEESDMIKAADLLMRLSRAQTGGGDE